MDITFLKENSEFIPDLKNKRAKLVDVNSILNKVNYPDSVKSVILTCNAIRKEGYVPYCVVLIKGKIQIGMNPDEIESFCKSFKGICLLKEGIKTTRTCLIDEKEIEDICSLIGIRIK